MRRLLTAAAALLLPGPLKPIALNALGHRVSLRSKIGASLLLVDRLYVGPGARIGAGNVVSCRRLVLRDDSYIESLNFFRGPFSVLLKPGGAVGKTNHVKRSSTPITYGPAQLRVGSSAKITTGHTLDLTRSIFLGAFSIVAGKGSQFWTHGYYHTPDPSGRFRVDGAISIGRNVYIGSACVVGAGVRVAENVMVGAHSAVTKSLEEPGLYVSQALRRIDLDITEVKGRLAPLEAGRACEPVYLKGKQ